MEDAVCAAIVHYEDDEIRGLATDLESHAAALQGHHRRGAPRTVIVFVSAASHHAAAVAAANDKRRLHDRRKHDYAACLIEQVLRNAVRNIENFLNHSARILDTVIFLLIFIFRLCRGSWREYQPRD